MEQSVDTLLLCLFIIMGSCVLVLAAVTIYLCWRVMALSRKMKRQLWGPQITRDGQGRRIHERL